MLKCSFLNDGENKVALAAAGILTFAQHELKFIDVAVYGT